MERLRVAHVITQLELGGAQQNTLYTVSHLDNARYAPSLVCGEGGILFEEAQALSIPSFIVPSLIRPVRPWHDVRAFFQLYALFRQKRPHIVHSHSSKAGILGRMAAYLAGVPVIIHTFHGFGFTPGQHPWVKKLFVLMERLCAVMSTHLIFVSSQNRLVAEALKIGPHTSKTLIRSGISWPSEDTPSLRAELGIPLDAFVIITVGNFKAQKNPEDMARVVAGLLDRDPQVVFLWVGDGENRAEIEKKLRLTYSEDRLRFLGWRKDTAALLRTSDCFVLTSLWEGLPRAAVEAAAAGKPIVAYAVDGLPEVVVNDETGYLATPGDVGEIVEKLLWLKNHSEQASRLGARAKERVHEEFDINDMVRQQESLYATLWDAVPLKPLYQPLWETPLPAPPKP